MDGGWPQTIAIVFLTVLFEAIVDWIVDTFKVSRRKGHDRHTH